jgi:heme-degrading monooxygenase HmoA
MVRHTVVFTLTHPKGSAEEKTFLDAAKKLSAIPGVHNFECLKQISKKNNFEYGLSMEFDSAKDYDYYSNHPAHVAFVEKYWASNVKNFMEIDYEPYQ